MNLIEVRRCIKKWHKEFPDWNAKTHVEEFDSGDGLKRYYIPVFHKHMLSVFKPATGQMWYAHFDTQQQTLEAVGRTPTQAYKNLLSRLLCIQRDIQSLNIGG